MGHDREGHSGEIMGDVVKIKRGADELIDDLAKDRDQIAEIAVAYILKSGKIYTYTACTLETHAVLNAYLDKSLKEEL